MNDFRKQWNDTCKAAGLTAIGKDTAAKLLAIVYVFGGDSETFTHSDKLAADIDYIEDVYGFTADRIPDEGVMAAFSNYALGLELGNAYALDWATKLMQENYGIKL